MLMPERMRQRHREGLVRYMTTRKRNIKWEGVELPGQHHDGHEMPLEISFGEMLKEGNHYFVGIVRDITDRKRNQEALAASEEKYRLLSSELEQRVQARTSELLSVNRELESFTYSVAHDLRAPARHIHGFVEVLLEDLEGKKPAELKQFLRRIGDRARYMGRLVDDLLHLATINRQELFFEATSLRNIADQAIRSMKPEIGEREVEWRIGELPTTNCDRSLILQLFQNLLSNALKFTRDRAKAVIEIGETKSDGMRTIFVRDNGIGFNMAYAGKLFHIFERLHPAAEFEGTGIGLATSLRIVQRHHGRIWAEAEEGKGATFYFTLESNS
jgi:light-regulated signal transduction histidine kinase (bacteriophytochrome)